MIICECDGASRGNPGPSAFSIRLLENSKCLLSISLYLGEETNNKAEYAAVSAALFALIGLDPPPSEVEIRSDSQLVINQINGLYKVKDPVLKLEHERILCYTEKLRPMQIKFVWVPREKLQVVDRMNNITLDKYERESKNGRDTAIQNIAE